MDEDEVDVDFKKSDVFVKYVPFSEGKPHPSPLVEASSLSFAKFPDVSNYVLRNPSLTAKLSAAQLDAVKLACAAHETYLPCGQRKGFYIGDSTGVGKGREIAGVISENYRAGRLKALWISCSTLLVNETTRDLKDVDQIIKVFELPDYGEKFDSDDGVLFTTYATMNCTSRPSKSRQEIIYRYYQIAGWLGSGFDGVIVLDECHKAKNYTETLFEVHSETNPASASSTKTGEYIVKLQKQFPRARILYVSATGISDIIHLQYMKRLGLFGPNTRFPTFQQFYNTLQNCGISSLELFGIEMKIRGVYIARQLSYQGVEYECLRAENPEGFEEMYERFALMWAIAYSYLAESTKGNKGLRTKKSTFWAMHQRFFAAVITSSKVPTVAKLTRELTKPGEDRRTVIIGLQSTGEAQYNSTQHSEPYSQAKQILYHTLTKVLDINLEDNDSCNLSESGSESDADEDASNTSNDSYNTDVESTECSPSPHEISPKSCQIDENKKGNEFCQRWAVVFSNTINLKHTLVKMYKTETSFPRNTMDDLISKVGGPSKIAELSGRAERQSADGKDGYKNERLKGTRGLSNRSHSEWEAIVNGGKYAAILTEAYSTGTSLHCNPNFRNKSRRCHVTMELPWSAEKLLQQFGRTHRSNQLMPPQYKTILSTVPAECRFISACNERIKQLGALTHGDRSALPGLDTPIDYNSSYSKDAIFKIINKLCTRKSSELEYIRFAFDAVGLFTKNAKGQTRANLEVQKFQKFYNRILGLPIWIQEMVFKLLDQNIMESIEEAKDNGNFDDGVKDYDLGRCVKTKVIDIFSVSSSENESISLVTVAVDRSLDWGRVLGLMHSVKEVWVFYRKGLQILLSYAIQSKRSQGSASFSVYQPNNINPQVWLKRDFSKWIQCTKVQASILWKQQYNDMKNNKCLHTIETSKECKRGKKCRYGAASFNIYILSGCLHGILHQNRKMFQSILLTRLTLSSEEKIIGVTVPLYKVEKLKIAMTAYAKNSTYQDIDEKQGMKRKLNNAEDSE